MKVEAKVVVTVIKRTYVIIKTKTSKQRLKAIQPKTALFAYCIGVSVVVLGSGTKFNAATLGSSCKEDGPAWLTPSQLY